MIVTFLSSFQINKDHLIIQKKVLTNRLNVHVFHKSKLFIYIVGGTRVRAWENRGREGYGGGRGKGGKREF